MRHTSLKICMIIMAIATVLGCAGLPTGFERPISRALSDIQDSDLGQYAPAQAKQFPGQIRISPAVKRPGCLYCRWNHFYRPHRGL